MSHGDDSSSNLPLEFWLQDIARRGTFVTSEHTLRGIFFNGMLENLRRLGGDELAARCLAACGETHFVDFFSYPYQKMVSMLLTALPLFAERHGGCVSGLRELGRRASIDFMSSVPGKALLTMSQGQPHSLLNSLPAVFRVGMTFGGSHLVWSGPRQGTLHLHSSFLPPPFQEGMLEYMIQLTSARDIHVAARATGDLSISCDFSWE
ncbi:MAG: TIGR02265 family protein [Cystobacter sp.]